MSQDGRIADDTGTPDVQQYLRREGGAAAELGEGVASSPLRFEGGAHYRIEIAGIETVSNLEAMIDEADRRSVVIHRVIAMVGGSALVDKAELSAFADIARSREMEVMLNPAAFRAWDGGRQYATSEGYVSGMRLRGPNAIFYVLKEIERCLDLGFRGFLVTDESLLMVLARMRRDNVLPADMKLKVSVFAGHGSPAGARLLEELGANSFNPLADLSLPMLGAIRQAVQIPLDVYLCIVDSMGGMHRFHEASEIARVCAPVYFKIEPGRSEAELYNTWADDAVLDRLARKKVQLAQIANEWVERLGTDVHSNEHRSDLAIPR
ncbi:MAG: hypothetical protein KKA32_09360 [Actinobacteria bacterium]|nr:hypothetical protein [Actinomycetota bacterium]